MANKLSEQKNEFKQLIVQNMDYAFNELEEFFRQAPALYNTLLLQKASYEDFKNSRRMGVLSEEHEMLLTNRIRKNLIDLVDNVNENIFISASKNNKKQNVDYSKLAEITINADLKQLEAQGLKRQAELLIKKLNRLQEALILEDDPNRQFKYEHQIKQIEKQLKNLQSRTD